MASMYLLKRPLDHFASVEESPFVFSSLDFSGTNIIVRGRVLYLSDIKWFAETLTAELRQILQRDLLFSLTKAFDVATWHPGTTHEEPRNTRMGYNCFSDPQNSFSGCHESLLKAVLDDPSVSGRFHFRNASGTIVWKAAPCLAYLERCEAFELMLFAATHTTVGEPPRGTEIASHLIRNISGGTVRNVLVMFQFFMLMGTFNKTSHATAKHFAIMRVPHPEIGRLWMMYITFVRPLIVVWQHHFHGKRAAARAMNNLFFGLSRPVKSRQLSQALSYHTKRLLCLPIPISLWRHIATWFLNHHAIKFQEHLSLSNKAALATQMGHSDFAHNLYASDAALPSGIDFHRFFQTVKTSGIWHQLLGFEPQLTNAIHGSGSSMRAGGVNAPPPINAGLGNGLAEEITALLLPALLRSHALTRANDLASLVQAMGIKLEPETASVQRKITEHLQAQRLADLRKFLRNPSATFKTPQQAEAAEVLASDSPSVLIVGPTGISTHSPSIFRIKPNFPRRFRKNLASPPQLPLLRWRKDYTVDPAPPFHAR